MQHGSSWVEIKQASHGKGVFAAKAEIPCGTEVTRFEGKVVPLDEIPEPLANYVVRYDRDHYLVPETMAMYVNHSCEPNCTINDDFGIQTLRSIREGEELTIAYNQISASEAKQWGGFWDKRWTFHCGCGARSCVGTVDRYIITEP